MLLKFVLKYLFRVEDEFALNLGKIVQKGSIYAVFKSDKIWRQESLKKKIRSILKLEWIPSDELLQAAGKETLYEAVFGKKEDFGEELFRINFWHNSYEWKLDDLTEQDEKKVEALVAMTILVRTKHRFSSSSFLHLHLKERTEFMCLLMFAMVIKVPVTSVQYYLDIDSRFTFNSIRKAKFPDADNLIAYIYDLQFIQQKIAFSLHEYLYYVDYCQKKKGDALIINAELSAIMSGEMVFMYLKASIEKIIVILGIIYGIKNLEAKKTHSAKLNILLQALPQKAKDTHYYEFIMEYIKSENIDELNSYRNGILHKRGIADLQPHNYIGKKGAEVPLMKIFSVLLEQHAKNTAILIGIYALLTDELVTLDPPTINPFQLYLEIMEPNGNDAEGK